MIVKINFLKELEVKRDQAKRDQAKTDHPKGTNQKQPRPKKDHGQKGPWPKGTKPKGTKYQKGPRPKRDHGQKFHKLCKIEEFCGYILNRNHITGICVNSRELTVSISNRLQICSPAILFLNFALGDKR